MINKILIHVLLYLSFFICTDSLSVSGISSGGYMAVQFHVAHSSSVSGAGIIAGGPYWCAQANINIALSSCSSYPWLISVDELIAATTYAAGTFTIDSPSNLQNSKAWLFSGTLDTTVKTGVMEKLYSYYQNYLSSENIKTVFNINAAHAMITDSYGNSCGYDGSPYINNCNFDGAGQLLNWIYGSLNPRTTANNSNIITIPQGQHTPLNIIPATISLDTYAYAYIPTNCRGRKCEIHVAFHGCLQYVGKVGKVFVENAGYNSWAESNNIIILYPQTTSTVLNPQGCWDWWGYTGLDYATKLAPQIITVMNMATYLGK